MLIMSRRAGDSILIGEDLIEIQIVHIGRSRVKLGIAAPKHIPVIAKEVKMVRAENIAAAGAPVTPAELSLLLARLK